MQIRRTWGRALALVGVAAMIGLLATDVGAKPGGGGSMGSRGSRTFSAPPATTTAPSSARPIDRTMTQPGKPAAPAATPSRPTQPTPAPAGGLFGRPGFLGGLAAGFLGAGLFGMLMGHGMFGGLGSLAGLLGLLFQGALIFGAIWLVMRFFRSRQQPAPAAGPDYRTAHEEPRRYDLGGGMGGGAPAAAASVQDSIGLTGEDFDTFERLLGTIQSAYGRKDLDGLRTQVTPEMASYFAEEIAQYALAGQTNRIDAVKLLQGDLSEAWREGDTDYATVAMRYELIDQVVEAATGRVISGAPTPVESIELWTFRRDGRDPWKLSAIQQVEAGTRAA